MFPRLSVRNFSCIEAADLEIARLTVLIGPQASGKSVISKLIHFACDALIEAQGSEFANSSRRDRELAERFVALFPRRTWSKSKFHIDLVAGDKRLEVTGPTTSRPGAKVTLRPRRTAKARADASTAVSLPDHQLFIPAGRAFFTSMSKAAISFQNAGTLDSLTVRFGERFAAARDRSLAIDDLFPSTEGKQLQALEQQLLGGAVQLHGAEQYLRTTDGRRIPFSILSSGQQELLPLWLVLNEFVAKVDQAALVYIEEPEAHLFPETQGHLVDYLVSLLNREPRNTSLLVTTHSPYVLSKLNNSLKAGSLGAQAGVMKAVGKLVPRPFWLVADDMRAYAIVDRKVRSLIGDDGLVDGDYLDSVSSKIGGVFDGLLDLELRHAP